VFVYTEWYPTDILLCFCFVWNTYLAEDTIVGTQQPRRFFLRVCILQVSDWNVHIKEVWTAST